VRNGVFSPEEPGRYAHIVDNLTDHDYFLVASDFTDYWRAQREVDAAYRDRDAWTTDGRAQHRAVGLVLVGPDDPGLHGRYLGRVAR
jgi:glucan phosphorylase